MSTKLSYDKFAKLLIQHGYFISTIYFVNVEETSEKNSKHIKFIEVRLPKTQKGVMLHITNKYVMSLSNNLIYKLIEIVSVDNDSVKNAAFLLTDQSLQYLINARGPLIESDLAVISSDGICYSRFNGENDCYFLASKIEKIMSNEKLDIEEDETESEENIDEIGMIEEEVNTIAKGAGVTLQTNDIEDTRIVEKSQHVKIIQEEVETDVENKEINENTSINEKPDNNQNPEIGEADETVNKIELEFVDEPPPSGGESDSSVVVSDDESDDESEDDSDVTIVSSDDESQENVESAKSDTLDKHKRGKFSVKEGIIQPKVKKSKFVKEESAHEVSRNKTINDKSIKSSHRSNYVIPDELDVYYGVIFVAINIGDLFKIIDIYEVEALSVYEQIEDNEKDMRSSRLAKIHSNLVDAVKYIDIRSKEIDVQERSLKFQLLRLTAVLKNIEEVRSTIPAHINITQKQALIGNTQHDNKNKNPSKNELITNPKLLEIDKIYNKTRKTIHELNVQLIKHRDEFEDLFSNYEYMINELLQS